MGMSAPFVFEDAKKSQAKGRIGITGPAGAGKTFTALLLASLMGKKIAVIDSEHGSASKYADKFKFKTLQLTSFHPNNYVQAIRAAEAQGFDVLVIDSASHEWNGKDGCLELVDQASKKYKGNSYVAWADVTPLHTEFIEAIHQSNMHIIATFRSKMDYIQTESGGRKEVKKVGMAAITREGAEYEFDVVGEMDLDHNMVITKSRCEALADRVIAKPGEDLAKAIMAWLSDGEEPTPVGKPAAPTPQPSAPSASAPKPSTPAPAAAQAPPNGKITNDQRRVMWDHAQALGLDVNGLTKEANTILGASYGSPAEMTGDEANRVILELERRQANAQQQAAS